MDNLSYAATRTDEHILSIMRSIQEERRAIPIAASEIADRAGCHINTVKNSVRRLERRGYIKISPEKGKPNRYELLTN